MPRVENGRRPAGYYFRARANERQLSMLSDEQFEELAVVNQVRQQVRAKYAAAARWCEAVSNWGQMGRWLFDHCGGPGSVRAVLARHGRLDHESAKVHETAKHESREVGFAQH